MIYNCELPFFLFEKKNCDLVVNKLFNHYLHIDEIYGGIYKL